MCTRKRIMIVDDNMAIHEDFDKILKPMSKKMQDDYEALSQIESILFNEIGSNDEKKANEENPLEYIDIDHAFQGEEAIKMVATAEKEGKPYSLIFMDVRMPPGLDGIETIQEIWKNHPRIEMVICTAYSDYSWDEIIKQFGSTDKLLFIKKPFDNVAVKQLAIALTSKWESERNNRDYSKNLELKVIERTKELNEAIEKLKNEVEIRKEKERELDYLASSDTLTGILNRYTFYKTIEKLAKYTESSGDKCTFSFLYLDLDNFKEVNDVYGHETGDILLVEATKRIRAVLNRLSTCEADPRMIVDLRNHIQQHTLYRIGGDEFIALLYGLEREQIRQIAEEIIHELSNDNYLIKGNHLGSGTSIGVSVFPDDSTDVRQLVKFADIAMYQAKQIKNTCIFFNEIENKDIYAFLLEEELRKSLLNEEIQIHYQGLMESEHSIIGIEALVRWYHPTRGIILPAEFIPVAEKTGQMIKIGEHILRTACIHLKKLHSQGFEKLFVLVNCTTRQFYNSNFLHMIDNALKISGLEARFLKIALDERFSIEHYDKMITIFNELSKKGIQVSIDSFGYGKSLLNFLQNVPYDTIIKIDRSYVQNIERNQEDREFLYHIIDMVTARRLKAIISGIENSNQKDLLTDKKCIYQGYYFNKPKNFDELVSDLMSRKGS